MKKEQVKGYLIKSVLLSDRIDVSHFNHGNELHIVEVSNKNTKKSQVVTSQILEYILINPQDFDNIIKNSFEQQPIYLVKTGFLEDLSKYGLRNSYLRKLENQNNNQYDEMISKSILADSTDAQFEFIQLVPNFHQKQVWKNTKGNIYIEPFILNKYAQLENETYFLDDLVEHLSHRDDIAFMTYMGRWDREQSTILYGPLSGNEKGIGGVISDIEHHLEEGESEPLEKECINLIYYPKNEQINQILNWNPNVDGRSPENMKKQTYNIERYIVKDILGGQKFLQNPPEIEIETPKRKFKH